MDLAEILGNGDMNYKAAIHRVSFLSMTLLVSVLSHPPCASAATAQPRQPMVYIFNGPESPLDTRYRYQLDILTAILERTKTKYGPYVIKAAAAMTRDRQTYELSHDTGVITVAIRTAKKEDDAVLHYVPTPIDKGILGYRVLLIRKEDQPRFSRVRSVSDLRAFSFGLKADWIDIDILRANGLNVVAGTSYEGLFGMLAKDRFDALFRATAEAPDEIRQHAETMPDLAIEKTLLLYCPIARYFAFSRKESGRLLAARVTDGLDQIIRDGTFDRIFHQYYDGILTGLDLRKRHYIRLENPNLLPWEFAAADHSDRLPDWFPRGAKDSQ